MCPMCDGPVEFSGTTAETMTLIQPLKRSRVTFSKVDIPYAFKLFDQEITTYTGSGLRFITEKSVGRLRDSVLNWNKQEDDESGQSSQSGQSGQSGGVYAPPQRYIDELKAASVIQPTTTRFPTKEELAQMPEGGSFNVIHAQAGGVAPFACSPSTGVIYGDGVSNKGIAAPLFFDSSVAAVSDKPDVRISPPVEGAGFKQRAGAAPVNHIDFAPSSLIRSDQTDGYTHNGQLATVNFIDPIEAAPIDPELPQSAKQSGGALIEDTLGSDINQAIFSMPAMDKEPYVVANPYVSPTILTSEAASVQPNQDYAPTTDALHMQPVSTDLMSEVFNTVQQGGSSKNNNVVFENSEIRVVKLQ